MTEIEKRIGWLNTEYSELKEQYVLQCRRTQAIADKMERVLEEISILEDEEKKG